MNFVNALEKQLNDEKQITENGAVGYSTSGKKLLDLNFAVSSMRKWSDNQIIKAFMDAYYEDKVLAIKWLFFARDIRGGLGERKLFRVVIKEIVSIEPDLVKELIPLLSEYGRWDDLLCLFDTEVEKDVIKLFNDQILSDFDNMANGKPVSLLAKWLPSANASSKETRRKALKIISVTNYDERMYRKTLTQLRKYIDVVEVKMSAKKWNDINYEGVPSRANLIYSNAFLRNDEERRKAYLESLEKGESKINSSTLYPHDIVHKYCERNFWNTRTKSKDIALEEMWKALPDYVQGDTRTICVVDGSGSMTCNVGNDNITALEVGNALGIYFAERCKGEFQNKYITFSEKPQLVDFGNTSTLKEKIDICFRHNECANTNIKSVFELILKTAINNEMSQEDIPNNILIISDMEFDCGASNYGKTLFENMADKYKSHGYILPRLVFWNVNSRTNTIPIKENGLGVALVSGFSPVIAKMVLSGKTDPFECLLEQLNVERYDAIQKIVGEYFIH